MITKMREIYCISVLALIASWSYTQIPNTVVATITAGVTPAGFAITCDSRKAYVANSNNYGINYGLVSGNSVGVIDLVTNILKKTIFHSSFNQPYTVTLNPAGTRAYVTNSNSSTVTVIDTATDTVIDVIEGFDGPSGMVILPNGKTGYVNNYGGPGGVGSGNATTVRVVDLTTNTIVGAPIVVGLAPAALAKSPDGAYVYVINYVTGNPGTGTLAVIRTSDNIVIKTIPGFSGPFAIVVTANGRYAYVTNFGSNNFSPIGSTVSVVDLKQFAIIATINLGIQPSGIDITPDGRFVYASNYNALYAGPGFTNLTPGEGTVNIIDTACNKVIPPTIVAGQAPHGVYISPDGRFAYVTNYISNTVTVIALRSFARGSLLEDAIS